MGGKSGAEMGDGEEKKSRTVCNFFPFECGELYRRKRKNGDTARFK
jgi:hypothetical protein